MLAICSYPTTPPYKQVYSANHSKSPLRIPTRDQVPSSVQTQEVKSLNCLIPSLQLCANSLLLTQAIQVLITQHRIRGQAKRVVAMVRTKIQNLSRTDRCKANRFWPLAQTIFKRELIGIYYNYHQPWEWEGGLVTQHWSRLLVLGGRVGNPA